MTDIALLGIQVDSKPAVTATDDLDDLTLAAQRAETATEGLGAASKRMAPTLGGVAKGASAVGQNSRMMAMQLSQVAQQASATGNIVQALSIQLPDMAMGFGAVGIAAGILASVTLPLLASAFGVTEDEGKAAAEAVGGFGEAAEAYIAAAEAAGISTEELAAKYGRLAAEARGALAAMADVALVDAINQADAAIQATIDSLADYRDFADSSFLGATETALVLRDAFDMTYQQAARLRQALEDLDNAQGLEEQARAASQVQAALIAAYGSAERMPKPLRDAYAAMAQIVVGAGQVNAKARDMRDLLASAAGAADMAARAVAGIGASAAGAYGSVADLAAKMWELASAKAAAVAPGGRARTGDDGRGGQRDTVAGSRTDMPDQPWMNTGKGGGGGGGGGDSFADDLKALVEEQRSELEALKAWYEEKQALLADTRAKELLGEQEHKAAMIQLEQDYRDKLAEIRAEEMSGRLTDAANLFGGLASIAEVGGKKMLKVSAGLSAAQTIIAGYEAAMTAAAKAPTLAGKIAAYAYWIGTSMKAVAAIRTAGGIGGGISMGRAAAQGATAQAAPQTRLIVQGIKLTDIITGEMLMDILGKEFGARNITFVR